MIEVNQKPETGGIQYAMARKLDPSRKSLYGSVCPAFRKTFFCPENVVSAALRITAMGVYEASLNGSRVGDFILAPGWTVYQKRLQVQQYELRIRPGQENELTVLVGKGWASRPPCGMASGSEQQCGAPGRTDGGAYAPVIPTAVQRHDLHGRKLADGGKRRALFRTV